MTILIVDDSESHRLVLTAILEDAGYTQLVSLASAQEALDWLGAVAPNAAPQTNRATTRLILMDLVMPGMTGIEACRRIQAQSELLDIPVIMVTTSSEADDLQAAFDAGALDYITKPVKEVELRARVRSALRLKQEIEQRNARERDLAKANAQLERLSNSDGLTGLANRRHFDLVLQREWHHALRSETPLGLLMLDIDCFKLYNDTYGHPTGDECLKQIAQALTRSAQRSIDLAARYGGEEFALILPNTTETGARIVAKTISAQVEALRIRHHTSKFSEWVTVSVGAASLIPTSQQSVGTLIELADQALYNLKRQRIPRSPLV